MASSEFGLSQIGQIAVNAHDVDRAAVFYRDVLGMKMLFRAGQLAFFDAGGIRIMLTKPEQPGLDHPSSILYFKVSDIKTAHATLGGRGARFEDQPHLIARMPDHELWMTHLRDSEDNLLALMAEVRA